MNNPVKELLQQAKDVFEDHGGAVGVFQDSDGKVCAIGALPDDIVHRAVEISYRMAAHYNYSPADTEIENLANAVLVLTAELAWPLERATGTSGSVSP